MEAKSRRRLNVLGVALIVVFVMLDLAVFFHVFQSADVFIFHLINAGTSPLLDSLMVLLSVYGRELFWGVLIVVVFVFGGEEGRRTAFMLGVLFLLLTVVGYSLKLLEFRYRPFQTLSGVRLLVAPEYDSSFPSGHALISMGGAAVAWLRVKGKQAILIGIESSLVAYSRIYVGVHYPLDVLSGSVLGIAIACLLLAQTNSLMAVYDKLVR